MRALLDLPNVVGYGVGIKQVDGELVGEAGFVALVTKKVPEIMLGIEDIIPSRIDVIEVGILRAQQTGSYRPAPGGVSVGHFAITAGTLGTAVKDAATGQRMILSNNHVLANSNKASRGDEILQPGVYDGGEEPDDVIALLERFIPIDFGTGGCVPLLNRFAQPATNVVDAALAAPLLDSDLSDDILKIGPVSGTLPPALSMPVRKSGRTTGFTTGQITVMEATVQVQYGAGQVATFERQIISGPMSAGGDSGSLLVHGEENVGVGLLFAGSDRVTIYNPIEDVLQLLGVTL